MIPIPVTMKALTLTLLLLLVLLVEGPRAQETTVLFHEDFGTLDNWKPFFFPKIKKHTVYTIEQDGEHHYLKAESNASASAIVYNNSFKVKDYPRVKWRWKVNNVYVRGDARIKAGDDYPLRVYVMFEYDPDKAGMFEKMKYGIAKKMYGEYPPHSSLSYVWSSKEEPASIIVSPYTDKAMMVLLQKGAKNAGTWQDQEVNVVDDYQKAFGSKPPIRARVAIMNDSDNTGERSISFMEYLEVFR
ncbi:MAG: DUF3047 domain-containing protein [Nitrospirae bacterium]|nr:DUF3047 domain-containing protein [Nitrospirota bacterium]